MSKRPPSVVGGRGPTSEEGTDCLDSGRCQQQKTFLNWYCLDGNHPPLATMFKRARESFFWTLKTTFELILQNQVPIGFIPLLGTITR